jgi:hypothetical protein
MNFVDQNTCGKGLAENSALPAKFGEVVAAVADSLAAHMKALDVEDEDAKEEHEAYRKLVDEHRSIAARLQATSEEMASYRDLPMGRHDQEAMISPEVIEAFQRLVRLEDDLLSLLEARAESHKKIFKAMKAADAAP